MLIGLIGSVISLPFIVKGEAWDETRYEYEPATGNLTKKIYPDGHQITYTYHYINLPKRITYASGKWMERNYNNRLQTLDKYIFDVGTNIGAHNGKPTSLIQLKVTPQGEIHIHPVSR